MIMKKTTNIELLMIDTFLNFLLWIQESNQDFWWATEDLERLKKSCFFSLLYKCTTNNH